jgi:hypothetical protein
MKIDLKGDYTDREDDTKRKARLGWADANGNACNHQTLEEARCGFSPKASGGSAALMTPGVQPNDTNQELLASTTVK